MSKSSSYASLAKMMHEIQSIFKMIEQEMNQEKYYTIHSFYKFTLMKAGNYVSSCPKEKKKNWTNWNGLHLSDLEN